MKKLAITLASVAAIATFAPEASALPVFARQVGMACNACHFQHFPLLNSFGRAFKANGYTMMGAQPMIEGENLSIPDRLNFGALTTVYYSGQSNDPDSPQVGVPGFGGEASLFYGGRVSENAGFLSEVGTGDAAAALSSAKLVVLFPVGENRVGMAAFTTGQGAGYGMELLNTGAVDAHKMMGNDGLGGQHGNAAYAARYMGAIGDATGASLVADGAWGFANVGVYAPVVNGGGAPAKALTLTYGRVAGIFDLGGWDTAAGFQVFGGSTCSADGAYVAPIVGDGISTVSTLGTEFVPGSCTDYALTIIDGQMQGEIAGMSVGFYAGYGMAPANSKGNHNAFAAGGSQLGGGGPNLKVSTLNLATSVEVVTGATVQLGARFAQLSDASSDASNAAIAGNDNALMIGITYQLAQNLSLGANYTVQSGSAWDAAKAASTTGADPIGKTAGTIALTALF